MNPKELIAVFGKDCKNCEYKYDCPDAFTELSHYCRAYWEDQKEEKDERKKL